MSAREQTSARSRTKRDALGWLGRPHDVHDGFRFCFLLAGLRTYVPCGSWFTHLVSIAEFVPYAVCVSGDRATIRRHDRAGENR